jgi:anthranilate phosphoribosyltransferase
VSETSASQAALSPQQLIEHCIQKIATGPEYSKDLDRATARDATLAILNGEVSDVQAAIYFIALRMKRETEAENAGVLDALRAKTVQTRVAVDQLMDVSDPYDGHNRGLPVVAFLPALLAACGLPAASHGLESVAPKFGITQRRVLQAAGLDVDLNPAHAADQIARPDCGWAYLDQRHFCPTLHALVPLRAAMVKRPVLTTVESLLGPLRAAGKTMLYTGYVHKAYPKKYAELARIAEFDSALIVRGVEGGVVPSLQQCAPVYRVRGGGELLRHEVDPPARGTELGSRAVPLPESLLKASDAPDFAERGAELAASVGLLALQGEPGPARASLAYAAALALWHAELVEDLAEGYDRAEAALDDGSALARLRAAQQQLLPA